MPNVLFFGASRGCGFYTALKVLASPSTTSTFILRKPQALLENPDFVALPAETKIVGTKYKIVEGDGTKREDVEKAFVEAEGFGNIDVVVFSIGGTPLYSPPLSIKLTDPDICRTAITKVLSCLLSPSRPSRSSSTRLIIVSSNGVSHATHAALPLPLRFMYCRLLKQAHADKIAMEAIVAYADPVLSPTDESLTPDVSDYTSTLPSQNLSVPVLIVQPALLTSGVEKGIDKVRSAELLSCAWKISRRDAGAWIAKQVLEPGAKPLSGRWVLAY